MMFGTWLAVRYAVPTQLAPTVWANTSGRPNPTPPEMTVRTPMTAAARPRPRPGGRVAPRSATGAVTGRAGRPGWRGRGPRARSVRPAPAHRPGARWPAAGPDRPGPRRAPGAARACP